MAVSDISELESALQALSLAPVPLYDEADVLNNPLDLCRSYLADLLASITECEPKTAYQAVSWPNSIFGRQDQVSSLQRGVKDG